MLLAWQATRRLHPVLHIRLRSLSTEHGVNLRIQSEYGKIRTRKNSVFGHFPYSELIIINNRIKIFLGKFLLIIWISMGGILKYFKIIFVEKDNLSKR